MPEMGGRVSPNGTEPVTLSLDKTLVAILSQLPSGDRSRRVNEILIANASLLGMDRTEAKELHRDFVRMRFIPLILRESEVALKIMATYSDRQMRELLGRGDTRPEYGKCIAFISDVSCKFRSDWVPETKCEGCEVCNLISEDDFIPVESSQ